MPLEKGKLIVYSARDNDAEDIEFMFNPQEVSFTRNVGWHSDRGNRGTTLLPKIRFGGLDPYEFTLQNLLFDTYEEKTSVMDDYIENIKQGVTARGNSHAQPPVYIFAWGEEYFHCVITSLTYRLTMFLEDGTPVRAVVDISLREVDPPKHTRGKPGGKAGSKAGGKAGSKPGGKAGSKPGSTATGKPGSTATGKHGGLIMKNQDPSLYLSKPILTLNGVPMPDDLVKDVLQIVVEESLHMPSMFMLVVQNVYMAATEDLKEWQNEDYFNIGDRISIGFASSTTEDMEFRESIQENSIINGEITGLEVNFTNTSEAHIVVRGYDASHRLHRGRHNRSFENKTESDIAKSIATECGITPGEIENSGKPRDYVFQENQTNMEFLRERAARIGFELFVQNDTLFFRKPTSKTPLQLEWLVDINSFSVRVSSAEQVKAVEVHSWDYSQKKLINETANTEQLVTDTGNGKGSSTTAAFKQVKDPTLYVVDQPVENAPEAQQMAQALCNELGGEFVWADAKAEGNPQIRPGRVVELQGMGKRYSGNYYVTETRHVYSSRVYKTDFTIRGLREGNLLSTLAPKPRLQPGQTLLVGIVTDNNDPEGWGRVKVKLPTLSEKDNSNWARVVGLGAGKDRGFYCLPEVDDEVLVGFEHGDIHRPYIIGGVWNGRDKTVETVKNTIKRNKVRLRTIKTRTGHMMQFVEEDHLSSKAGIEIKTKGRHRVHLCDNRLNKGIELKTSGRHHIQLNDSPQKSIEIQTARRQYLTLNDLTRTATLQSTNIIMTALGGAATVTAGGAATVNAGGAALIKAGGAATLDAGGVASVKAGASVNISAVGNINLVAPTITLTGIVNVLGTLFVNGRPV